MNDLTKTSLKAEAPVYAESVFIFLRSGILIRNFSNTELLKGLKASGYRYVIFAPSTDHPALKDIFDDPCFVFEYLDLKAGWAAMSRSRLGAFLVLVRRHTYGNAPFGVNGCRDSMVEAMRCEIISKASFVGRIYYELAILTARIASRSLVARKFMRWLEKLIIPYDLHAEEYEKYQPIATIVTSLGFDQDSLYMREAKQHNSQSIVLLKNWDVPTTRGIGASIPDQVLVWNEIMKDEVVRYHDVKEDIVQICGVSQWDYYFHDELKIPSREEFCNTYELSLDKKTIYFAMTTPTHFHHNIKLLRHLAEAISEGRIPGPVQLLTRLHPSYVLSNGLLSAEAGQELNELKEKYGHFLSFSYPESLEHDGLIVPTSKNDLALKAILTYSDLLVTVYSTQMIEGLAFDLPVINAGFWKFRNTDFPISTYERWDHIKQIMEPEAILYCYEENELIKAINAELADKSGRSEARINLANKILPPDLRGIAGSKTSQLFSEILSDK